MQNNPVQIYSDCYEKVRDKDFKGYDPYDLLNCGDKAWKKLPHRVLFYLTQVNKRSPVNFRPAMGVEKTLIPKGKSLILSSLLKISSIGQSEDEIKMLVGSILNDKFDGYHGACWGLPFEYANRKTVRNNNIGDVVATSYVHEGLFNHYQHYRDEEIKSVLLSCSEFVLMDLEVQEHREGLKLNYDTQKDTTVFNAIGLASDILVRNYQLNESGKQIGFAEKLLNYIVYHQEENGLFPYSLQGNSKKYQTDFHQLYVISSLLNFKNATGSKKFDKTIERGLNFYLENQVSPDGAIYWRLPKKYPIDIHNQASAIYYLSKFSKSLEFDYSFIDRIYHYAVENFYSYEKNYFYYQKYPLFVNKVNYVRWGQAWMLYALSEYINFKNRCQ
ncbi:hypothetical protein DYD21_10480 [Rhodohalobacter sp. SW132]|uniref:hypothetical protein n=1 Tax=Rhodohalobacter sp. SW132 TaxID=2293433 RepID=UPI000E247487|nr:hypothetical protein [Rhodohalobacter sp. SW132]REL33822.1 hypothetical protein DYD21_10480 [Rhodohalobacter sp. SW132]